MPGHPTNSNKDNRNNNIDHAPNNYSSIPTSVSGPTNDDYEPVRPNMTAGHLVTSQNNPSQKCQ